MKNEKLKSVGQILLIPINQITENPLRARIYYNDRRTDELTYSIAQSGIIEPLTVCAAKNETYVIVSGERRFRAAKKLGYKIKLDTNGTLPDRLAAIMQNRKKQL